MTQEIIKKISCEELAEIFREAGFRSTVEKWDSGKQYIIFGSNGGTCTVNFYMELPETGKYECFILSYGVKYEKAVPYEIANEWNMDRLQCRAYITETGGIRLDYTVLLRGGITWDSIEAYLKLWDKNLGIFLHSVDKKMLEPGNASEVPTTEITAYDKNKLH